MTYYVALMVGCLECGETTTALGAFKTRVEAIEVLRERARSNGNAPEWIESSDFGTGASWPQVVEVEITGGDG